jgi:hypothetical protein
MLIPGVASPGDYDVIYHIVKAENAFTDGDIAQWSDTASADYPLGVSVEDSVAGDGRVAGVIAEDIAINIYGKCQIYGYNTNITTDGNVAGTDLYLTAGAAVAVGATAAEINASITTADILTLDDRFAWNVSADVETVGQGFIKTMGL